MSAADQRVALLEQIVRHVHAHVAQTDEADTLTGLLGREGAAVDDENARGWASMPQVVEAEPLHISRH